MSTEVKSYEELLTFAEQCMLGETTLDELDIGQALDFKITIKGSQWDGSIDYRLAGYITKAQRALDDLVKELDLDLAKEDRPIIKFRINEGSLELLVKITEAAAKLFENMEGRHKAYVATVLIMAITGGFGYHEFLEYKDKQAARVHELQMEEKKNESAIKQQEMLVGVVEDLIVKIPAYQAPARALVNMMDKDDTIESSIDNVTFSKKEIKKRYKTKSKFKAETVYIDDTYTITAIKIKAGKITIEKGSLTYDCQSSLSDIEADNLFSRVKSAHAKGEGFELELKITAEYFKGSNTLQNLIIYEIGPARNGAKSIDTLLAKN